MAEGGKITPINIEDEMKIAYIDYSMSVIISRALPDVRDGLKPVHRRVLYGMADLGVYYNRSYKKSARIVGEVLGKYHPHGDASVYDSMVRMAQTWSLRMPLVDGQGNYGSIEGDPPAAMRYTEARLKEIAGEMLSDIKKDTVNFQANFDDSLQEPVVLPAKIPNLLVNGTSGIAVGMATNMAPHNLGEVIDGIITYIDNRDITIPELMEYIKAPDFPTGGIIYGYDGVKQAFETGRGRIVMRAVTEIEEAPSGKTQIVVTEIPYMVNLSVLLEKTASIVNEKKIEGITAVKNFSDKKGIRIVYELKKDAIPDVVLNNLFKHTPLQTTFNVNNVALVKGRPQTLNLKDLIYHYVEHRHEVVIRRTEYDLNEARKRLHILEGLLIALDHLDEVIALIRKSVDPEEAKQGLISQFELSEIQARAILDMRLQRLTGLERDKIQNEHQEVTKLVTELEAILASEELRMGIIKDELTELKDKYADPRRSSIEVNADNLEDEDMIPNEEMVLTISNEGYIKRTNLKEYRIQARGGMGSRGVATKDDDYTAHMFVASNHNYLLIFTKHGKVYWLKVYKVPEGSKISKGRPIQNLIQIEKEDSVRAVINVKTLNDEDYINNNYLIMSTTNGIIKKTPLEAYSRPRQSGITAITVRDGDDLLDVMLTDGNCEVFLGLQSGRAIRFHETEVRPMGRTASGVRGITPLHDKDYVIGMVCIEDIQTSSLLVISENGYGKRSNIEDYRKTGRGGKGVKTLNITPKTGGLVAIKSVQDTDGLMIVTKNGITIRMSMDALRIMGRTTQGVKVIRVADSDAISSVAKIEYIEEVEAEIIDEENGENNNPNTDSDDTTPDVDNTSDNGQE
ncbi:DNA gyrase subunit A [Chondrinema litorale]|uniref:DNA gyrase subunit A n=1 Tax=Chondrinema litorale TaxID=2994555 RepID=UPI002544A30E|nr:DNA gyrase subunit A [Chondrinema litorale]UZR92738.1 DNA gyrase subunit A [Chondrinema litorale]